MDNTGNRGDSAAFNIGDRTGDGTGGRNAAEKGNYQIGNALPHQFLIGVVSVIGERVSNAGA